MDGYTAGTILEEYVLEMFIFKPMIQMNNILVGERFMDFDFIEELWLVEVILFLYLGFIIWF